MKKRLNTEKLRNREHRRDRNSFLCVSRSGAYYRLFVGDETLYLFRTGGELRGANVRKPVLTEQEALQECGQIESDRMIHKSDILRLRFREKSHWAWYGPVKGLLVIQTRSGKRTLGVLGDVRLQDVRDALMKFPNADIDDGAKKQAAMEIERRFALRRTAEGYKKAHRIYTATWVAGITITAACFFCSEAVGSLLVVPVTILPSLLLLEYLLFAAYMDINYDPRSQTGKRINPGVAFFIIVLMGIAIPAHRFAPVSFDRILLLSVPIIAVWMYFLVRYSSDYQRSKALSILLFLFMLAAYIPFSLILLNANLDRSTRQCLPVEVLDKSSGKSGGSVLVRLPDDETMYLSVSLPFYREVEPGNTITIAQKQGALHIPYYFADERMPILR